MQNSKERSHHGRRSPIVANAYFETCSELWQILDKHPCTYLTGASGSFEVLQSIENIPTVPTDLTLIPIASFESVYNKIIYSSLAERLLIPGLPMERTKLIVVGFILMDEIIKRSMPEVTICFSIRSKGRRAE